MKTFPARIHVLLASKAPVGLVIRRGPAKQVATLLWDRRLDTFTLGQWFKGKIYERRSDLSPDGKLFLYFAMNGKWHTEARGSWTAISRAPYIHATTLFPWGHCWYGGGLWTGNSTYWLNDGRGAAFHGLKKEASKGGNEKYSENFGGECPGVYYHRLIRDGWNYEGRQRPKSKGKDIFTKLLPSGWTLRKIAHSQMYSPPGKGCYWDEHELVPPLSNSGIAFPDWEWADTDRKRLVWASNGKLFGGRVGRDGLKDTAELYDFNDMKFELVKAPY